MTEKLTQADLDYLRNINTRPGPGVGQSIDQTDSDHPLIQALNGLTPSPAPSPGPLAQSDAPQEPFAWAYRRRGFEGWNLMSSKPEFGDQYENMPLYTTPPALPEGAREAGLIEAVELAIDLLAERKFGNPARSAAHNARVVLERAVIARAADRSAT